MVFITNRLDRAAVLTSYGCEVLHISLGLGMSQTIILEGNWYHQLRDKLGYVNARKFINQRTRFKRRMRRMRGMPEKYQKGMDKGFTFGDLAIVT